jgi:hypothetical protein
MKKLNDLPKNDDDYWEGEKYVGNPTKIPICDTHGKNWKEHIGYKDNHDGTASCKYCGWGFIVPGYLRIHEEKVYDLRSG